MAMGLVGNILYSAITTLTAGGIAIGGAKAVKSMLTPQPKSKSQDKPLDKKHTIILMENILNYKPTVSDPILKPQDQETKNFLLKLGVHVDVNASDTTNLSDEQIATLQRNIKDIDRHLGGFGIQKQPLADINNLKYWFKDLGQDKEVQEKTEEEKKKVEAEVKQNLKHKRLAKKAFYLLNPHDSDNPVDPKSHIKHYSLEELVKSALEKQETKNGKETIKQPIMDPEVLTTILHAKVFPYGDSTEKRKINYAEFSKQVELPANVGISKSDFDAFQSGTKKISNLMKRNYKTILETSDFDGNNPLPTDANVFLDKSLFLTDLTDDMKKYIKDNADKIYINVEDVDALLSNYKKIAKECDVDTAKKVNFETTDTNTDIKVKNKAAILQNKEYGNLIGELLKAETGSTITDILKKEKNDVQFDDIANLVEHYQKSEMKDSNNLFALITDIAPDNLKHDDTSTDIKTLITRTILHHLNKSNDNKDEIFIKITETPETYATIQQDYPDIMDTVFKTEMENYTQAGKHISETELNKFFSELANNNFSSIIRQGENKKAQTYIYKKFLAHKGFTEKSEDEKLDFLKETEIQLPNNEDIQILLQQELQKINIHKLSKNNQDTITSAPESEFNDYYKNNISSKFDNKFSMSELIFGNKILNHGKKDRLSEYTHFITEHELEDVATDTTKPQDIAKLIMVHKLKTKVANVTKLTAKSSWHPLKANFSLREAKANKKIDKDINALVDTLPDTNKDAINEKLKKHFGDKGKKSVTIDTISAEQMKLLMNWVEIK